MFDACPHCGYSLDALPPPHRCPECGLYYDEHARLWRAAAPRSRFWLYIEHLTMPALLLLLIADQVFRHAPDATMTILGSAICLVLLVWIIRTVSRLGGISPGPMVLAATPVGMYYAEQGARAGLVPWVEITRLIPHRRKPAIFVYFRTARAVLIDECFEDDAQRDAFIAAVRYYMGIADDVAGVSDPAGRESG